MARLIDTNGNVIFDFGTGPVIITDAFPDSALIDWGDGRLDNIGVRRDMYALAQQYATQEEINRYLNPDAWRIRTNDELASMLMKVMEDNVRLSEADLRAFGDSLTYIRQQDTSYNYNVSNNTGANNWPLLLAGAIGAYLLLGG
jgi:dsDNA-specific endonuclease/ATPase MutS2